MNIVEEKKIEKNIISLKNVVKKFDGNIIISDVSFNVREGTIHAFVGPNGAGKSTIINLITNILVEDGGEIKIDGLTKNDFFYGENISLVNVETPCLGKNVEETVSTLNILIGLEDRELSEKFYENKISNFKEINLNDLSTGWKKIFNIFILELTKRKIMILDEPFNGLDPIVRREMLEYLLRKKKEGCSILLSSHILSDLQEISDDITMIKKGKIIYTGKLNIDIEKEYFYHFKEKEEKKIF